MLTPLTNSVLVGLVDEAAVEATGATTVVDIGLDVAVEPSLLVVDIVNVSLENVTTAAGEVWIPAIDRVPKMIPVSEGYVETEDRKEPARELVLLSLVWACKVEEDEV